MIFLAYILVYGYSSTNTQQNISLLAQILDFEVISIDADIGGNTGPITVKIRGSKFTELMGIRIENATDTVVASNVMYIDPTTVFAELDLTGITPALLDVVAISEGAIKVSGYSSLYAFETTSLSNGFEVVAGTPADLQINFNQPANVRPNQVITLSIEFTNTGNVNLIPPVLTLSSFSCTPLSFDVAGLSNLDTEIEIILWEPGGPPGVLRPGFSGSIVVFSKATSGLGFNLSINNN